MCNIGSFFEHLFAIPGSGGQEAAQQQAQAAATAAQQKQTEILAAQAETAAKALKLQEQAQAQAKAAAVPLLDSASARKAAEDRQRQLLAASSFSYTAGRRFLGEPPVGFRTLAGV